MEESKLENYNNERAFLEKKHNLKLETMEEQAKLEAEKAVYKMRNELITDNIIENKILSTTEAIYYRTSIRDLKMLNFGSDDNKDATGKVVG